MLSLTVLPGLSLCPLDNAVIATVPGFFSPLQTSTGYRVCGPQNEAVGLFVLERLKISGQRQQSIKASVCVFGGAFRLGSLWPRAQDAHPAQNRNGGPTQHLLVRYHTLPLKALGCFSLKFFCKRRPFEVCPRELIFRRCAWEWMAGRFSSQRLMPLRLWGL